VSLKPNRAPHLPDRRQWRGTRALALLALAGGLVRGLAAQAELPAGLIGSAPPAWQLDDWHNGPSKTLADLRGRVVLVRWWTAPGCRYCAATAPALNTFHDRYERRGLAVVGLYHHKAAAPLRVPDVQRHAARFGFKFPVAIDHDWRTLKAWWFDRGGSDWTSVTFLLDRAGVVRHVHPGGEYVKGDRAYAELEAKLEELLAKE
jgi:peroxiredoxin